MIDATLPDDPNAAAPDPRLEDDGAAFIPHDAHALQDLPTMVPRSSAARRAMAVLAVAASFVMTSCGVDDGLGRRYPVSGTVTYNDQPLEKGVISFIPEDSKEGVGATGAIEGGKYILSTGGSGDGARAGKYKVTITAKEDASAAAEAAFQKARASVKGKDLSGAGEVKVIPKQFMTKAAAEAKSLIPTGYGDVRTTNLTAEVKEQSNTIPFKLSDADAPPEPEKTVTKRRR